MKELRDAFTLKVCTESVHRCSCSDGSDPNRKSNSSQSLLTDCACVYGMWCGVMWCGVMWCGVMWCGVVCGVWCVVCGVSTEVRHTMKHPAELHDVISVKSPECF